MLPIYVCDDFDDFRDIFTRIIKKVIGDDHLDMEVVCSASGSQELLDHLRDHQEQSIYFLDLHLKESPLEGLELAKEIRKYDPRGYIIIVTTYTELSTAVFKYHIEAMDYIVKGVDIIKDKVRECLLTADHLSTESNPPELVVAVHKKRSDYIIKDGDIYYIKAVGANKICIVEDNGDRYTNSSLSELEDDLKNIFVRCHRSYIVNVMHIVGMDTKSVVLDNGQVIPVSRRQWPELESRYHNFMEQLK